MRGKSLLAFAMAIGCGLVAMVGVQQVLKKQTVDPDADKVAVFVAKAEILPGTTLDVSMLEKRKFLKGSVPMEAVTDIKQLDKRALTCKVMPGDIIRSDKLGAEGKTGASISIPLGMRMVTVPTTATQAHSGMIQPGDRVDVMVSYRVQQPQGGRDYPETKTVLGYIQVFAVDNVRDSTGAEGGKAAMKSVSLIVTPEQAQVLMMAQSVGTLHMSVRNAGDSKEIDIMNLTPEEFRDTVVLHGHSMDEPDPTKQETDRPQHEEPKDLNNFLDTASGKSTAVASAPVESNTESWDIAFYGKSGVTVETLEIPRRPALPKATAEIDSEVKPAKSVMGAILNIWNPTGNRQSKAPSNDRSEADADNAVKPKPAVEVKPTAANNGAATARDSKSKPSSSKTSSKTPNTNQALPSQPLTTSLAN